MRSLIVFHDLGTGRFARFLAPGFRHCFVSVLDERAGIWVRFDGRDGQPNLGAEAAKDFDLAGFYRNCGYAIVETTVQRPRAFGTPFMLGTCVGAAKRILGIHAPFVLTPAQLYLYLIRHRS